jgi:D-glycero-D-manno-heptose 1,7-bisphosphate phosphatase
MKAERFEIVSAKRAAVFLDRDGVINGYVMNADFGTVDSPGNVGEFRLLAGAAEAVALLKRMGYLVIVVSNQPGVARGRFTPALLDAVTEKMKSEIAAQGGKLDAVYYCLHKDPAPGDVQAGCSCRKPKPGMLLEAAREHNIDLARSYMVGDGITDVLAGTRAGTKTIFVSGRKCYICEELERQNARPDFMVGSLLQAARLIESLESRRDDFPSHAELDAAFLPCRW